MNCKYLWLDQRFCVALPTKQHSSSLSRMFPIIAVVIVLIFATLMFTTFYSQTSLPTPTNSIVVTSSMLSGTPISGVQVDLRINGTTVKTEYTPATFSGLTPGLQYQVVVYWLNNIYFRHFSDGNLERYATVTLNGTKYVSLDAEFESVPQQNAAALNVLAEFPNGTQIGTSHDDNGSDSHTPGMWVQIIPPGSTQAYTGTYTGGSILPFIFFNHETYTIQMTSGYGNLHFAYWKDNLSTNPTRTVTLDGNQTFIAVYEES
jgi:hypothetical protein